MTKVLTRARRHWRGRPAAAVVAVGALLMTSGAILSVHPAQADGGPPVHKSYVCKWVGQPGTATERLQTGDNPIWVDNHAIDGYDGTSVEVGDTFTDGQNFSVVIVANTPKLTPEPSIAACFKKIPVPAAPSTQDPCNPPGVSSNIAFVVPEDTYQLDWTLLANGNVTVAPKFGYAFLGDSQLITFQLPADSGVPCEGDQEIPVPAKPAVEDPCDPGNIHFVVPADTDQLDWTLLANGNVTVTPKPGFKFPGASQLITFQLPADSNVPCQPTRPDPITQQLSDERMTCELGVESRTGTQTTTYVWDAQAQTYDAVVGPQVWDPWTFVRDLTDAEFEALDCRPDQPEPVVIELTDERMGCEINVQGRDGTQTTSYVWNAATRDYDAVVGPEVWGDWMKLRDLTAAEAIDLDCIAGEQTVVPKPQPKPDRQPVVLGTEAAVPTAVAAGLGGDIDATPSQRLGHGLIGAGGLAIVVAGWLGLARRTRGVHEG